jgi:hypothetical protein
MTRWDAVRGLLVPAGDADSGGDGLWQRIEATRSRGISVELPRERFRMLPRIALYATLGGTALLALVTRDRSPAPVALTALTIDWSWPLLPAAAFAQGNQVKHLPAIGPPNGTRLSPGRWVYSWIPARQARAGDLPVFADTVTIRRGTFREEAVWLVTQLVRRASGQGAGRLDSLYLSLSSLRPLRSALLLYRPDRVQRAMAMDFEPDSVRWQFRVPGSGSPGRDTIVVARLPAQYAAVWPEFPILLNGIQFTSGWSGAVPILLLTIDWAHNDAPMPVYWADLRVKGRQRVTVPAGTFDCWRVVQTTLRGTITELWIDTRSGVLVKEAPGGLSYSPHGRELAAVLP